LLALFPCRQLPELTVEHEEPGTVSEISDGAAQFYQDARQSAVQFLLGRLPLGLIAVPGIVGIDPVKLFFPPEWWLAA
jgi:hypothetical protein